MGRRDNYIFVFIGMIVIFAALAKYPNIFGLSKNIGDNLSKIWASLLVTCIGIYLIPKNRKDNKFFGMICLGIGLSILIDSADTIGIVPVGFLGPLSLVQAQTWIMVVSVLLGAVLYSS